MCFDCVWHWFASAVVVFVCGLFVVWLCFDCLAPVCLCFDCVLHWFASDLMVFGCGLSVFWLCLDVF